MKILWRSPDFSIRHLRDFPMFGPGTGYGFQSIHVRKDGVHIMWGMSYPFDPGAVRYIAIII